MSGDHAHVHSAGTYLPFDVLAEQFGADQLATGAWHALLAEQLAIVAHQWASGVRRGAVRGYLLDGPPGVGKTTLAKRLGYELGLRFPRRAGRDGVATVLLDGSEIARAKYGESERRIRDIFDSAAAGFGTTGQRALLIFDDVESILMSRGSGHAKEWHYSQDSVFFHAVDELDTSRVAVVLTTNRIDLVDDAIRDRFLEYRLEYPPAEVLIEVATRCLAAQGLGDLDQLGFNDALEAAVAAGSLRSLRDAQRLAVRYYVAHVTGGSDPVATQFGGQAR